MSLGAGRQRVVGEELAETLEDVSGGGIGSRVVLVAVPAGWGRSAVLRQFAAVAGAADGPVILVAQVAGALPPGRAVQAEELREALAAVAQEPWIVRRLGLDTAAGRVVPGRAGGVGAGGRGGAAGGLAGGDGGRECVG